MSNAFPSVFYRFFCHRQEVQRHSSLFFQILQKFKIEIFAKSIVIATLINWIYIWIDFFYFELYRLMSSLKFERSNNYLFFESDPHPTKTSFSFWMPIIAVCGKGSIKYMSSLNCQEDTILSISWPKENILGKRK